MPMKGNRRGQPAFVTPIREDGTVIDPPGGGGGGTVDQGDPNAGGPDAWPITQEQRIVPVKSLTVSASGDTPVVTPATGKKVRLTYLAFSADGANTADVVAYLKFGSGAGIYKVSLTPKAIYARNIGAGRRYVEGAVDEALSVNLSIGQGVHVTVEYEEV